MTTQVQFKLPKGTPTAPTTAPASSSKAKQFLLGGVSGMIATSIVQPVDLVKTRMQLMGEGGAKAEKKNTAQMIRTITANEGFSALYKGLTAALFRQATYTTGRLGSYDYISTYMTELNQGKPIPFYQKAVAGMMAGAIGAVVGTPAEVALIRMTADGRLPVSEQRGYRNVVDALYRITKEEGVLTLWKGCAPTVVRAMILNAAQLATYSQAKQMLLATPFFGDNMGTHFTASLISGLTATAVSLPVDMAKTRIQTQKPVNGVMPYKNSFDVLLKTVKGEGVISLWKGFTPYFLKLGPHTIITFVVLEQLNKMFK